MKSHPAVATALQNDDALRAEPEVVIDWNINRYVDATASNTTDVDVYDFDNEFFPIESIIEPMRPTKGINKARVGSATVADDYLVGSEPTPNGRFYIADVDDDYKYWTSPKTSDAATGALTNCKPQVVYAQSVAVNKLVFTFENTWASPKTFNIQTTTSTNPTEANWTTVATQTTTPTGWKGKGQIVLYWDGSDWLNTNRAATEVTTNIRGVRIVVTALEGGYAVTADGSAVATTYGEYVNGVYTTKNTDGKDARFDLIEIGARLEVDISSHVISISDDAELSEASDLYPVGTITSNQGAMELSNLYQSGGQWVPGLFSKNNTASPYHNYIDANAEVTLRYKFYDTNDNHLGTVQQFKMYTNAWTGQASDAVSVDLADYSKFFNETNMKATMWENLTVPQIVWRILDSVGFVDYDIDTGAVTDHLVPIFYTDGESTIWDVLDELAKASQTAIYFDAYGTLKVKTREFAFSPDNAPVWDFSSESDANRLSDIIALDIESEFEPNHYKVIYQKTNWDRENRAGQAIMQKVWEPEGTEVLRGTPLYSTMGLNDMFFKLEPKDARTWPYEGLVNIDGELIRYKGKEFVYFTGTNGQTRNTEILDSYDKAKRRNADTPAQFRHKNHFTGRFAVTERAVWNSEQLAHPVNLVGYSVRGRVNGNNVAGVAGMRHLKKESRVLLNAPKRFKDYKDVMVATKGDTDDTAFFHYGTKFRFVKGPPQQFAGILIHNSGAGAGDGYYIELTPSKKLGAKERKDRNELIIYSRTSNRDKRIGGKGQALPIGENIDYEIDVAFTNAGGNHRIQVWFNGKSVMNETISGANMQAANGKFGLFVRGKTKAEFEYLYAVRKPDPEPADDFSFMDKLEGGYSGQQWNRHWVFRWKDYTRRKKKRTNDDGKRFNKRFMDEFGPYVHEVREYDVKFDPAPVLHSRVYNSNDWASAVLEYSATPFGAKFIIANTQRYNAVINGDDSISFAGTRDAVSQILTVFGRALIVDEAEEVIAKNEAQIRRRGKIESELSSTWIQSRSMADALAGWLNDNFSYGNEELTMEIFGNPLVEISDVVHVTYPDKHIDDDYFVTGISNSFDAGINTTLKLRRRA